MKLRRFDDVEWCRGWWTCEGEGGCEEKPRFRLGAGGLEEEGRYELEVETLRPMGTAPVGAWAVAFDEAEVEASRPSAGTARA